MAHTVLLPPTTLYQERDAGIAGNEATTAILHQPTYSATYHRVRCHHSHALTRQEAMEIRHMHSTSSSANLQHQCRWCNGYPIDEIVASSCVQMNFHRQPTIMVMLALMQCCAMSQCVAMMTRLGYTNRGSCHSALEW